MEGKVVETRLLGPPEILVDGEPVDVDTRKAIALLAYLTVERSSTRDVLATLLWAESSQERARATLRRTLSSLRSAIGPGMVDADRLRVTLHDGTQSDVASFEEAIGRTTTHGHSDKDVCQECIDPLMEVARLYLGDFLEGFSIRDAPEFEDWVRATAEHFRLRAGESLQRLASAQAAQGDYLGAIGATNRWLEIDLLDEPAHRQLMLLYAWSGDRPGAIEAYRRCVAVLGRELEVPPLEETTELYEAILDEDLPPAPSVRRRIRVAEPPARSITPSDLIGRANELALLHEELALSAEHGRLVIVTGEPWMGKTRLVEEFLSTAERDGITAVKARGFRGESSLPFGVVAQAIRDLEGLPDSAPHWVARELSRIVPELAPGEDEPPPAPEAHGEVRLFDAVIAALASEKVGQVVLWIDDAQWSDPASTAFLGYLARRIEEARHLLVVCMRRADPETPAGLRDLAREPNGRLIELSPLRSDDLTMLIEDPDQADEAIARTGGIPLLVSEYLQQGGAGPGTGIHQFVATHVAELSGLETQVLTSAAVLGGDTDLELLRATSGRSEDEIVGAVESLSARDLLRMEPGAATISFALEAVEHLIYETTSVVRRRLLHGRAGAALSERAWDSSDGRLVTSVARHLHMSGAEGEAADWYFRAGDLSFAAYAHTEAENSYQMAQALGHPEAGQVRLSLANLYLLTGRYQKALGEFDTVAATSSGEEAARAEHGVGEVHRRLGRFELAVHHFERAEPDHPDPALLYADWGMLALRSGDTDEAMRRAKQSLAEAEAAGEDELVARAHHLLGVVTPDAAAAPAHFEKALELAEDMGQRMASLNGLARAMGREGNFASALPVAEEALRLAETIGDRHRQAALLNHLADIHQRLGDTARAEELVTQSVRLFAQLEPDAWEPEIWLLTGW